MEWSVRKSLLRCKASYEGKSKIGGSGRFSVSSYRCLGFGQIAYIGGMCSPMAHSECDASWESEPPGL